MDELRDPTAEGQTAEADWSLPSDEGVGQQLIDEILGLSQAAPMPELSGARALTDAPFVSSERVPMLDAVFERLARLLSTSARRITSDKVEVRIERITTVRFGSYLNEISLPSAMGIIKAEPWNNFALVTLNSGLIYSLTEVVLGGSGEVEPPAMEGRAFTPIEMKIAGRFLSLVLADTEQAFSPLCAVTLTLDHLETIPRFAAIVPPGTIGTLARLRVEFGSLRGHLELMFPYTTLEPRLLERTPSTDYNLDPVWSEHIATQIWQAETEVSAILATQKMTLGDLFAIGVGDTLLLDATPDDLIELQCGGKVLAVGRMGRAAQKVAVRVEQTARSG